MTEESKLLDYEQLDNLACLLLPLNGFNLLLPTVSVAEMVPYEMPFRGEKGPQWYLGEFYWRNIAIPLISYEIINGEQDPGVSTRARVAILNCTGQHDELPFLGIVTQGIPRLAQVENEHIIETSKDIGHQYDLMKVQIAAEDATIPDLPGIEKAYLSLDV
jgi:chemosensory pili system protein ChpC